MRLRFFRIAGLSLGGLLLAGVAFLHLPPGRSFALRQLQSILAKQGIRFDASGLDYNLLSMRVRLRDVQIQPKADMPALAKVAAIDVDASLFDLVRGKIVITNAALTKPEIFLLIDTSGRSNLPELSGGESKEKRNVILEFLSIDHASLRYEDRKSNTSLFVPDWQVTVDGDRITERHDIFVQSAQPVRIGVDKNVYTLNNLQASLQLGDQDLQVKGLNLETFGASLKASGSVRDFANPVVDVRAHVAGNLEGLSEAVALKPAPRGAVTLRIAASGPLPELQVAGHVSARDVQYEHYSGINAESSVSFDRKEQKAVVNGLRLQSPYGNATADANLALDKGTSTLRAALNGIRVDTVTRLVKSPVVIASTASGTISAQWPALEWNKSTTTALVRLQPTRAAGRDFLPVAGNLDASLRNGAGTIRIRPLQTLGAAVQGSVGIDAQQRLNGELQVDAPDLAKTREGVQAFLASDIPALAGSANARIVVAGTVKNPAAELQLDTPALTVGTLEGVSISAKAAYRDNHVEVGGSSVRWRGQEVQLSGSAGLGKSGTLDFTAQTANTSIADLLRATGNASLPIDGSVTASVHATGRTATPQVDAKVTAANLTAYKQPFGDFDLTAALSPQKVATANFALRKTAEERLTGEAVYTLEGGTLTAKVDSTPLRLTTMEVPGQGVLTGSVQLTAATSGTAADPRVEASLEARGLTLDTAKIGDVTARANYANQRVDANVEAPLQKLTLAASANTQKPYAFEAKVDAQGTDLASLPLPPDTPVAGQVTLHAEAAGDAENTRAIRASLRAERLDLRINNQPVTSEQPLLARLENGIVYVDQAAVRAPGTQIAVNGSIPLEPKASGAALQIDATADLAVASDVLLLKEKGIIASGQLAMKGGLKGSLQEIDPDLTLRMSRGLVTVDNLAPIRDIELEAAIRDGAAAIAKLSAHWTGSTITVAGNVPFALLPDSAPLARKGRTGPASLQASVTGLDLSRVQNAPDGLKGKTAISLNVEAPRPDLQAATGQLRIDELVVDYNRLHIAQSGTSSVRLANGIAAVEQLTIEGTGSKLSLAGSANLMEPRTLDLRLNGTADIALASMFTDTVRAQGPAAIDIAAKGPVNEPSLTGSLTVQNGELAMRSPRVQAERLNLRFDINGKQATLTQLEASVNGGRLTGSGTLGYQNGSVTGPGIALRTRGVYLDFPANLRTVSDVDIKLTPVNSRTLLSGTASIREGAYTEPLNLDQGLFNIANRSPELDLTEDRNPFLDKLDYNLAVKTIEPLVVDNNLAKAELEVDAKLTGEYYEPGLTGRVTLLEGGELNLNERRYFIDRGVVTFVDERKIAPSFDILARTQAAGYDINLSVQGAGKERETTLTSDPPLSEPDIASILLTGRTLDRLQGSEADVAKEQVLSYLTGRVGGSLGRGIEQATGISQVRIEPNLIANESDPSARLTIGQNITRQLSLIYSMNLTDSGDQILVGQYDFARRFRARALKQSDNSYRMDFSRTQEFGGDPPPPRNAAEREKRRIGAVQFTGQTLFDEKKLTGWLNAKPGKQYDFFKIRKGMDKISDKYADAGLLESRIRLHRERNGSNMDLQVDIVPGTKVEFVYEGFTPSRGLRKRVREQWTSGVFDVQRAEDAAAEIRKELVNDRYVQAVVDHSIDISSLETKRVTFDVQTGPRFDKYRLVFAGAKGVEEGKLRAFVKEQGRHFDAVLDPKPVIDLVTRYYREQGYLDAKVARPDLVIEEASRSASVVFPVDEGPLFRVDGVEFQGNTVYTAAELAKESTVEAGNDYKPVFREETITNLRSAYSRKGYNEAEVNYLLARTDVPGRVKLVFQIQEGPRSVVESVSVAGNRHTSQGLIKSQFELKPGDPLNLDLLSRTRTNLYSTGAFSLIDIDRVTPSNALTGVNQPVNLVVNVREVRPFLVNYGGYYDTERGPGGIVDISNRNMLGSARTIGARARYDSDLQEGRLYFTQPLLKRFPLRTTLSSFVRREIRQGINTDRIGFSILQESRFRNAWLLNYGYRWEKTRTYENIPDPLFDARILVAPFTVSLSRDTRDDILDATRGQFLSNAIEYAPTWSGSELNFIKYFGQYFRYHAFDRPKPLPGQKGLRKSRLVYAGGVRVGLAGGLNEQDLIPGRSSSGRVSLGERFFAGGGTTVRGFAQDGIGPRLFDGISPAGGDALFVMNHELRFPLWKIFDGVSFLDVGNVYDRASDFKPWDVRKAAGLGIRIRTPYFLIRFDYGIKLDRKPGEPLGRPFFSIGQAF
ncbi:MAG TPA: translocation/assembly module TamB domain-containing protein [Bryobacteraceae bacterium]|nr:translocation/assembly module TamB domain-containing protein [Bryobacteraceae bacterium]